MKRKRTRRRKKRMKRKKKKRRKTKKRMQWTVEPRASCPARTFSVMKL